MIELRRGLNGAVGCGDKIDLDGDRSFEFTARDSEALEARGGPELSRGRYIPCSALNLARMSSARWRAASVCWAGKCGMGVGLGGLGA